MDVVSRINWRRLEYFHSLWVNYVLSFRSRGASLVFKRVNNPQPGLQCGKSWECLIFLRWKHLFVGQVRAHMQEVILARIIWSRLGGICADLCSIIVKLKFQSRLGLITRMLKIINNHKRLRYCKIFIYIFKILTSQIARRNMLLVEACMIV